MQTQRATGVVSNQSRSSPFDASPKSSFLRSHHTRLSLIQLEFICSESLSNSVINELSHSDAFGLRK